MATLLSLIFIFLINRLVDNTKAVDHSNQVIARAYIALQLTVDGETGLRGFVITNAIKYSPGSPVVVTLKREGSEAVMVVRDQGPGIPNEKLELIFEPFEQIGSPERVGGLGLGLGLYIVRQIMQAHDGEVHVESIEGKGSSFIAKFPLS